MQLSASPELGDDGGGDDSDDHSDGGDDGDGDDLEMPHAERSDDKMEEDDGDQLLAEEGYMPPHELLKYICQKEKRPLPLFLYALATGRQQYELRDGEKDPFAFDRSKLLAVYTASDLLLRAVDPKNVGHTTRLVDYLLECGTETETREILSTFRLTTCRENSRIKKADAIFRRV